MNDLGVLTLATRSDYQKAIGLALSLKVSNPGVPCAVACEAGLRALLEPYFDHVIDQFKEVKGFEHKVHLDQYTPFESTLFMDSDILVFKPLKPYMDSWAGHAYTACGLLVTEGFSCFGFDRKRAMERIGADTFVQIDGAGHALFHKPECLPVFERARQITAEYADYGGGAKYADEDVMNYVMTEMNLPPMPYGDFFSRYCSGVPGTMKMDARSATCNFISTTTGLRFSPCIMHFAAREAPFSYTTQLFLLFRKFGVPYDGLLRILCVDFNMREIKPRLRWMKKYFFWSSRAKK